MNVAKWRLSSLLPDLSVVRALDNLLLNCVTGVFVGCSQFRVWVLRLRVYV